MLIFRSTIKWGFFIAKNKHGGVPCLLKNIIFKLKVESCFGIVRNIKFFDNRIFYFIF